MSPQLALSYGSASLPSIDELHRRFIEFNAALFGSKLPSAELRWSTRLRIAGTCDPRRRIITLSRAYHEHYPGDLDDTLKHEMIHLRYHGHGPAFRREATRVGATVHCKEYAGLHPKAHLRYVCPHCHREFRRMKPAELYCGRCSRGHLHPSFRLVLAHDAPAAKKSVATKRTPRRERARQTAASFPLQLDLLS
jgi:predicted SprT family Zn-dependent metalloprotease